MSVGMEATDEKTIEQYIRRCVQLKTWSKLSYLFESASVCTLYLCCTTYVNI